jgi:protoporphyrin/coproporphyrin ferrochelatase
LDGFMPPRYDAFVLLSFGGPEGPDDVMPFLRNVTSGRGVPDARLAEVAGHYHRFGGVSPINAQCRDLLAAIEKDFAAAGIGLPVYWGNRNWQPYLADTVKAMARDGVRRAIAFATSAYSSFSSCRQYLDDIELARERTGPGAPEIDKIVPYYRHRGFAACFADSAVRALGTLPAGLAERADLVFTAHSLPEPMALASGPPGNGRAYQAQLAEVAGVVARGLGRDSFRLAYSSRSGPPAQPWLEPDVNDCLAELAGAGSAAAVLVPIGFVSDHMEVIFDLDVEAADTARRLGLPVARAATPGTAPRFVSMITELTAAMQAGGPELAAERLGGDAAGFCRPGCCGRGHRGAGRPAATAPAGAGPAGGRR